MRARLKVYEALSQFRHRENGILEREPTTIAEIPD